MRFVARNRIQRALIRAVLTADRRHLSRDKYAWTAVASQ